MKLDAQKFLYIYIFPQLISIFPKNRSFGVTHPPCFRRHGPGLTSGRGGAKERGPFDSVASVASAASAASGWSSTSKGLRRLGQRPFVDLLQLIWSPTDLLSKTLWIILDDGIIMDPPSGVHPASSRLTCGIWNIICEEHCRRRVQLGFNLAPSSSADFGRIYRAYSSSSLSLSVAAWDPGMFGMVWAPSPVLLGICRIINNFQEFSILAKTELDRISYWPTRIIVVYLIKRIFMEFLMELHGLYLVIQLYTIVHHHSQLLTIMNHHQPSLSLTFIHIH